MNLNELRHHAESLLTQVPDGVTLIAAVKTRSSEEAAAAVKAGIINIGHNYVQEAEKMKTGFTKKATWHLIGHLQRNKAGKAAELFDMVQTIDSFKTAQALDRRCSAINKTMRILIEVNSGRESGKAGIYPEQVSDIANRLSVLPALKLEGLMTMGPFTNDPEEARPFFKETALEFHKIRKLAIPNVHMNYLSMGMSSNWKVAVEEGANMVRIGTELFGPR